MITSTAQMIKTFSQLTESFCLLSNGMTTNHSRGWTWKALYCNLMPERCIIKCQL